MELTKREVKSQLGLETDADLARFFKIGRWAVGQWAEDEPIPDGRQWQLRALRPDLFPVADAGGGDPARQLPAANGDAAGTQVPPLKAA